MLGTRLLLLIVFVPMLVEARVSAVNERTLRARGGVEPPDDVYAIMRIAYPGVFLAMILEGLWWPGHERIVTGLAIFASAKVFKSWAMASLGDAWTFRVIVVPGMRLVSSGPYRWLRHPNYVAVAGELVGVALMSGARISGLLGTILFTLLMIRRISIEERALTSAGR
jgi:methyltransferase